MHSEPQGSVTKHKTTLRDICLRSRNLFQGTCANSFARGAWRQISTRGQISVPCAQVTELSGPEMRAFVDNLRGRFWGDRRDGALMPTDMQETCTTLEADMRDMRLRSSAALKLEPASCSPPAGEPPRKQGAEALDTPGPASASAALPNAAARALGQKHVRFDDTAGGGSENMIEIDRSGFSGGEFYVLWSGSKPDMHPECAAVLLACASHAWLLPEYLQSLVAELEIAMLETEDLMGD